MWIEPGFEQFKSAGWQWQKTRMTGPERINRIWLALALATLWVLRVGGKPDRTVNGAETFPRLKSVPGEVGPGKSPKRRQKKRLVSVLRQGIAFLLALLITGQVIPPGQWYPEPWPELAVIIQERAHEQYSPMMENLPQ